MKEVDNMKKILFLGGSKQQIPAIQYAKDKGYFTILCDFLKDNPGQFVADKFYCESTTDLDKMLEISLENEIDGIVAYASDPAALTAAYVGNKMHLHSNPYKSVEILSKKNLFRKFLSDNGFNCPKATSFKNKNNILKQIESFRFPLIIKPIDSSGSKGVSKINSFDEIDRKFDLAMENSRGKVVIIEEFIEREHEYMIAGDAFVIDGKVVYFGLLNSYRDFNVNEFVPIGTSYPTLLNEEKIEKVKHEVQRVVDLLEIKNGALNLELMFDCSGRIYIIEIGPRNGGNMIPDLLKMATDVDLISATVESALGETNLYINGTEEKRYYSTYVIHSNKDGVLKNIKFDDRIKDNLIRKIIYKNEGDFVECFNGANKALGIVFLKFNSLNEQIEIQNNINDLIKVELL